MKTGPLRLRHLFIDRSLIEASEDERATEEEPQVSIELGLLGRSQEEPHIWRLQLTLKLGPGLDPPANYRIEMTLSGVFEFADSELDEKMVLRLVAVNGLSILYTAAREHVWMQTSRGRWGSLALPTMNFSGIDVTERPKSRRKARKIAQPATVEVSPAAD